MEFNTQSAEEKLQKYMEYNEAPDVRLGGLDYEPNELPDTQSSFSTLTPSVNATSLQSPYTQVRVKEEVEQPDVEIESSVPEVAPKKEDPIHAWANAANQYKGTFNINSLKSQIAKVESEGMGGYKAYNPGGGGEGAVGKYQFRWKLWKPQISKFTGITDKQEFMNNPKAQEDFFDHYQKTTLEPQLQTIKKEFPDSGMSDNQIMKLLHFRGLGKADRSDNGLRAMLSNKTKLSSKAEKGNLTATDYLARSEK